MVSFIYFFKDILEKINITVNKYCWVSFINYKVNYNAKWLENNEKTLKYSILNFTILNQNFDL